MSMDFGNITSRNGSKLNFNYFDTNGDGGINRTEFEVVRQIFDIAASFDTFDKNNNDAIEGSEFLAASKVAGAGWLSDADLKIELIKIQLKDSFDGLMSALITKYPGSANETIRGEISGELTDWFNNYVTSNPEVLDMEYTDIEVKFKNDFEKQSQITCTKFEEAHSAYDRAEEYVMELLEQAGLSNYADKALVGIYDKILEIADAAIKNGEDPVAAIKDAINSFVPENIDSTNDDALLEVVKANLITALEDQKKELNTLKSKLDAALAKLNTYKTNYTDSNYRDILNAAQREYDNASVVYNQASASIVGIEILIDNLGETTKFGSDLVKNGDVANATKMVDFKASSQAIDSHVKNMNDYLARIDRSIYVDNLVESINQINPDSLFADKTIDISRIKVVVSGIRKSPARNSSGVGSVGHKEAVSPSASLNIAYEEAASLYMGIMTNFAELSQLCSQTAALKRVLLNPNSSEENLKKVETAIRQMEDLKTQIERDMNKLKTKIAEIESLEQQLADSQDDDDGWQIPNANHLDHGVDQLFNPCETEDKIVLPENKDDSADEDSKSRDKGGSSAEGFNEVGVTRNDSTDEDSKSKDKGDSSTDDCNEVDTTAPQQKAPQAQTANSDNKKPKADLITKDIMNILDTELGGDMDSELYNEIFKAISDGVENDATSVELTNSISKILEKNDKVLSDSATLDIHHSLKKLEI